MSKKYLSFKALSFTFKMKPNLHFFSKNYGFGDAKSEAMSGHSSPECTEIVSIAKNTILDQYLRVWYHLKGYVVMFIASETIFICK